MENDNDLANRRDSEYRIKSVGSGFIVCSKPGLQLVDFYRTSPELASAVQERYEKTKQRDQENAIP